MAMSQNLDVTCDSCSVYFDGDPMDIMAKLFVIPEGVHDLTKVVELSHFWLCDDCKKDYPNGAKDVFVDSYFTEDELYLCEYCDAFIPEVDREGDGDVETTICVDCSSPAP